ncbi:MAG: hypothetical protein ABI597_13560 [Gammaproteobacteria bacterium]
MKQTSLMNRCKKDLLLYNMIIFSWTNCLSDFLNERDVIKEIGIEEYYSMDGIKKGMAIDKVKGVT